MALTCKQILWQRLLDFTQQKELDNDKNTDVGQIYIPKGCNKLRSCFNKDLLS